MCPSIVKLAKILKITPEELVEKYKTNSLNLGQIAVIANFMDLSMEQNHEEILSGFYVQKKRNQKEGRSLMPRARIGRKPGEDIKQFIDIGKAKKRVKQSAIAKYLCVSEKTISVRKADGNWTLTDFAQLCKYFHATDEEILGMVRSYQ